VKVAVCVCTCDREEPLRECLAAVAQALRLPLAASEVAVFVIDNRPDGRAKAVCEAARPQLPAPLHFFEEHERGISHARNRAVGEALAWGADLVAFIDDDDLPTPEWLARLLDGARASGAELVFGAWRWPAEQVLKPWQRDIKFFRTKDFEERSRFGLPAAAGTFNVGIRRELLERMAKDGPWFRLEFALAGGGDTDFFVRAHGSYGASYAMVKDSIVLRRWDAGRTTFLGVLRRSFRMGNNGAMQDREVLDERRLRRKRRRIWFRLARLWLTLPLHLLPTRRFARHAFEIARLSGDAYGRWWGRRFQYYETGASLPAAASPSPKASAR
jgi:glycosyltransferase involved in cell wall biosynthesis